MATNSPARKSALPNNVRQIWEALDFVDGTIEFDKYAAGNNPSDTQAARKRIRQAFEAYGVNVTIRGNTIVGARSTAAMSATSTAATTSASPTIPQLFRRTPKRQADNLEEDEVTDSETPETPARKKSKATAHNVEFEKKVEQEDGAAQE